MCLYTDCQWYTYIHCTNVYIERELLGGLPPIPATSSSSSSTGRGRQVEIHTDSAVDLVAPVNPASCVGRRAVGRAGSASCSLVTWHSDRACCKLHAPCTTACLSFSPHLSLLSHTRARQEEVYQMVWAMIGVGWGDRQEDEEEARTSSLILINSTIRSSRSLYMHSLIPSKRRSQSNPHKYDKPNSVTSHENGRVKDCTLRLHYARRVKGLNWRPGKTTSPWSMYTRYTTRQKGIMSTPPGAPFWYIV